MLKQKKGIREIGVFFLVVGFILGITTLSLSQVQELKRPMGIIKGRILDYETQTPLNGVTITIKDSEWTARSDETGTYVFPEIPVGYYVVSYELEGFYTDARTDVIVRPGRTTFVNVELFAVRTITEEVRVTADYFPTAPDKPGSQRQFNTEELRRNAGSAGDVSRALYDVPGIAKADEEANDLIVRGGSMAQRSHSLTLVACAVGLACILDHHQALTSGDVRDGIHVSRLAIEMNGDNRPGLWGDRPFDLGVNAIG